MDNVLFASSNGIGLGHLARQMAIASRLADGQRPVFFTLSYAVAAVVRSGYLCLGTQHHHSTGMHQQPWNKALGEDYRLLVETLTPKAFVYDATAVFGGTVNVLLRHPDLMSLWVRRAMWRPVHGKFLEHSFRFKHVIEPGELAEDLDTGPTKDVQSQVLRVAPVLNLDPDKRLSRLHARRQLGLPDEATVICLQLANGSDFDISDLRRDLIRRLLLRKDVIIVELRSALNRKATETSPEDPRYRTLELFPSYLYSRAWDAAISAAGYNSFHENVIGAVPTLFVPNEGEYMDLQLNRAVWAQNNGYSLLIRKDEPSAKLSTMLDRILDTTERNRMSERCGEIRWKNGATAIAHLIDTLPSTRGSR